MVLTPQIADSVVSLSGFSLGFSDPSGQITLDQVRSGESSSGFAPLLRLGSGRAEVHWVHFSLKNLLSPDSLFYLRVTFTDHIQLYEVSPRGIRTESTGDLTPIPQRSVPNGQFAFLTLRVPYRQTRDFYLRLASSTSLSRQFKAAALQHIELYPRAVYQERFVDNRIYQALFFGACLIMLLYNAFMAVVLRERSYFYYLAYLFALIVFFASNNGYLAEGPLAQMPRLDLYVRFLVTPLLLTFYLLFSRTYLISRLHAPQLHRLTSYLLWGLPIPALVMFAGGWSLGRTAVVLLALCTFPLVLVMSIQALRRGYTPARHFLAANALLLSGGVAFAVQRLSPGAGNLLTQYGIQIGSVLELALFSLGLAYRIQIFRQQLVQKQLENERLERLRIAELQKLAEEKNQELEEKVIHRTAEILAQKEEILAQNELLAQSFEELTAAQELISQQNAELAHVNVMLEHKVQLRTEELVAVNVALQKSNAELDRFIYRTAHDIKGPLARLQGLSYLALLEVNDETARTYLQKLFAEAKDLNAILTRLSTVYDLKHQELRYENILFEPLLDEIVADLRKTGEYDGISIRVEGNVPSGFRSDRTLIRFIIRTLVDNGLKFQRKPPPADGFVAVAIQTQHDQVQIRVMDNGIGIEPQYRVGLFDIFSRAAKVHQSPGLSLYMCRLTVERLGGHIHLASDPPGYTVFEVCLPLSAEPVTDDKQLRQT